jgi:hypothetical protein
MESATCGDLGFDGGKKGPQNTILRNIRVWVRPDRKASERATKKDRTYVLLSKWPYWLERVSDVAERASDIALQ